MRVPLTTALTFVATAAAASHLNPLEVPQPVVHENGVSLSHVTFLVEGDFVLPGLAINYICRPYEVPVADRGTENRNAAALAGIRATPQYSKESGSRGLFGGDTLRVILDLSEAHEVEKAWTLWGAAAVVRDCILDAAARDRRTYPALRFVDIQDRG